MADFPQSHTTHTTTTTTTTTIGGGRIQLDVSYIKTIPGILRIVEIVLLIILFICSVSACSIWNAGQCGWGGFVGFVGFLLVIGWLLFYLFHVQDAAPNVPWLLIELIFYVMWTFFLLVTGIALAVLSADAYYWYGNYYGTTVRSGAGAGSFFAFITAVVFGFHTFLIFRDWRSRTSARGPVQGLP